MSNLSLPPLRYGQRDYPVRLSLHKNNRRLRLSVDAAGTIRLSAPAHIHPGRALAFLEAQRGWLQQQLAALAPYEADYGANSEQDFLGTSILLQPYIGRGSRFDGRELALGVKDLRREHIAAALLHWYKNQAKSLLPQYLAEVLPHCPWVETIPPLRIRSMRRQWGNCAAKGTLTFNSRLIKAAPELIRHVVLHELCHLREFNHSPRFYALMQDIDPAWQDKAQRLKALSGRYLR